MAHITSGEVIAVPPQPLASQVYGNASSYTLTVHSSLCSEWILDTGATNYICCQQILLSDIKCVKERFVHLPNDSTAVVACASITQLNRYITLHNVLCIPEFHFNLISISTLTRDTNYLVSFTNDSCVL